MEIIVTKRDGSEEPFQKEKIIKVTKAAGMNPEEAKTTAANVSKQIENLNKARISSLEIRDIVLKEMEKINKYSADLFKWYQHVKEKDGKD